MATTPWTEHLSRLNRRLAHEGPRLHGRPVKLRVRHKALDDGSRAVDVVGHFDGPARTSNRASGISIAPGNFEPRLAEAVLIAEQLVKRAQEGEDTHAPRGWSGPNETAQGVLARQVTRAEAFLRSRSEHRGRCRPRQLATHLRWLGICQERAQHLGRDLSLRLCLEALRDHYGGVDGAPYRQASLILRRVCEELDLPARVPDELLPRYRFEPVPRTDIPPDDVIAERLKLIEDPEEARLIYAVVAYGRRVAEIYYADWEHLEADGDLPVYSSKTNRRAVSWPMPFGDESIDLTGFRPPLWDELASVDRRPEPDKAVLIEKESAKISRLIKTRLGCTATDLRHRWGSACLFSPDVKEDVFEIALAMLTSLPILEKTYTLEMRAYRKARKAR